MAATPESKVKDRVRLVLDAVGARWVSPIGSVMGRSNMCDFIACIGGRFIEIEAKAAPGLKPTKLQAKAMEATVAAGGLAFVVHPGNVDGEFLDFILLATGLDDVELDCAIVEERERKAAKKKRRRTVEAQ